MKKEMTNMGIVNTINFLSNMMNQVYPFQITRSIVKTLQALQSEYQIYKKSYDILLDKYYVMDGGNVCKNEDGTDKLKDESKRDEAIAEISKLLNETVDVDIYQFEENELNSISSISPQDYAFFLSLLVKTSD